MSNKLKSVSSLTLLLTFFTVASAAHFVPAYLEYSTNPYLAMNITVTAATLEALALETGDEIGIYDGSVCVGSGVLDGTISTSNMLALVASAQESSWPAGTGFTTGNAITYLFWDLSENVELYHTAVPTYLQGDQVFTPQGSTYISLDCSSCTTLASDAPYILDEFTISQNYPNPFNPVTNIIYGLPENTFVQMEVFDITGKKVQSLVNKFQTSGSYSVNWNASSESSGVYFVKMIAGKTISTKKLMLIK